jgi:WD40 repeat protein
VVLRGHSLWVRTAVFSPDGTRVLSASGDGTARVWPVAGGAAVVIRAHDRVESARFSTDGSLIVTAGGLEAKVWRADGTIVATTPTAHRDFVKSAVFSPDGARVVTESDDGTAQIWTLEDNTVRELRGHGGGPLMPGMAMSRIRQLVGTEEGSLHVVCVRCPRRRLGS